MVRCMWLKWRGELMPGRSMIPLRSKGKQQDLLPQSQSKICLIPSPLGLAFGRIPVCRHLQKNAIGRISFTFRVWPNRHAILEMDVLIQLQMFWTIDLFCWIILKVNENHIIYLEGELSHDTWTNILFISTMKNWNLNNFCCIPKGTWDREVPCSSQRASWDSRVLLADLWGAVIATARPIWALSGSTTWSTRAEHLLGRQHIRKDWHQLHQSSATTN